MATSDRSAYPRFPLKVPPQELAQHYTPSPEELQWAQTMSREHRLRHTALVLLKCFQQLHYFPELNHIPAEISQHIAQVMGLGAARSLAVSAATRHRQETAIRRYLGITPFYGTEGRRVALRAATAAAPLVTQRVDLVNAIIDELLRGRVELPAYSNLVQIAEDVASEGETDLIDLITSRLNEAQRRQLDHLLHTDLDQRRSAFDGLKRVPKRPSRDHLEALIEQCHRLDEFGDVDGLLAGIPYLKRRYYANYALALDAGDLKDLIPAKRYTLVLTMIQRLRARVRDDLGEMFVRRMATIHQCAQEELEHFLVRQRQRTHAVAAQFDAVLALVVEDLSNTELGHRIRRSLGSRLQHWREKCAHVRAWGFGNYLPLVWNHFRSHRAVLFRLVRAVTSRPTSQGHAVMAALRVVLRHEQDHGDTIAEAVDLSFTTARWRRLVTARSRKQTGLRRRELEACVLTHLAASLRAGNVALVGGDSYADYREQLLPGRSGSSDCPPTVPRSRSRRRPPGSSRLSKTN